MMHHLDTQTPTENNAKPSASTPKKHKPASNPTPKKQKKKKKHPQPWDDPHRLQEIQALAERILSSEKSQFTKAEVVSRFDVNTKLAGHTLAWMVATGKLSMATPQPMPDDPDPKKIFNVKDTS